jgi:hypothetical protein
MIPAILLAAVLCLGMVLPYLPGRFDASASAFSFLIRAGSSVSLLMVPVGLAWLFNGRRFRLWRALALVLAGLVALVVAVGAVAINQLAMGVMLGAGAIVLLRTGFERARAASENAGSASHALDILQHDGERLDLRRGDRRRTPLAQTHWMSMLFD